MSKIEQLKKQYPSLSISFIELAKFLDSTKSNKYTSLICKIISENLTINDDEQYIERFNHLKRYFSDLNITTESLSLQEMFIYKILLEHLHNSTYETISDLIEYGERGLLPTKDILTYKNVEEIKRDISLASIKDSENNFNNQVIKEFENDTWLAVRPLTYMSSLKYGASTKWCTTSRYEKQYFGKYWNRGVLVYFINKSTGYKFAGYKGLKNNDELSFWNALDNRIDSLDIECESYLYDIIKNIFKSDKTNSDLCDFELRMKVAKECNYVLYEDEIEIMNSQIIATDYDTLIPIPNDQMIDNNTTITDTTYIAGDAYLTPTMRA